MVFQTPVTTLSFSSLHWTI